ncbi:MAG: response regulator [Planctomycetia bacterium]|nr:response regulator [Planctomycetia bacterium]
MNRVLRSQSHVVVTDPRPLDYRNLAGLAGEHAWHVHFLTSGGAAIQFARRGSANLWMINVSLPDISGFDVVEMLRDLAVTAPVFLVADRYRAEDERQACLRGASLYLCKDTAASIDCPSLLEPLLAEKKAHPRPPPVRPRVGSGAERGGGHAARLEFRRG